MKRQTRLFPWAVAALERLGENIKLARRRRGITSALMAEQKTVLQMYLWDDCKSQYGGDDDAYDD